MALFQPVNVMGPAHRGNQISALAQNAAQNVMRRQKMKSLLRGGAAGARAGSAQQFQSSMRAHPQGVHGGTFAASGTGDAMSRLAQMFAGGDTPMQQSDPGMNPSGSGYDFPSITDHTDPSQSPGSTQPGPQIGNAIPQQPPGLGAGGWTPPGTTYQGVGGLPIGGALQGGTDYVEPIHLGGGMYYDPATDTVTNGTQARTPGLQY